MYFRSNKPKKRVFYHQCYNVYFITLVKENPIGLQSYNQYNKNNFNLYKM